MDALEAMHKVQFDIDKIVFDGLINDTPVGEVNRQVTRYILNDAPRDVTANWVNEIYEGYFNAYNKAGYDVIVSNALANNSAATTISYYETLVRQLPNSVTSAYVDGVNKMKPLLRAGQISRSSAVARITESANLKGVYVYDSAGRRWKATHILKRHIRDEMRTSSRNVAEQLGAELGTDLYYITEHGNQREKCAPYAGWLISSDGRNIKDRTGRELRTHMIDETSFGQGDGLFGYGCRHSKNYFVEGKTIIRDNLLSKEANRLDMEDKRYEQKYSRD